MTSFIAPDMFAENCHAWPFSPCIPQAYDFIMIDPPWKFENRSEAGEAKGPNPHYPPMEDHEILALPVRDLARDDCLLWAWATWPKLPLAMACIEAWGFEYKTGGAWNKRRWGTGYIWRSKCEPVLIASRGSPKARGPSIPNLLDEGRREHSRKPECAYAAAEQMMPKATRADVFSRTDRPGWTACGDEAGKFNAAPIGCDQQPGSKATRRTSGAPAEAHRAVSERKEQ